MFDICATGTRNVDDRSDEEAAYRELEEELGVRDVKLKEFGSFLYQNKGWRWWNSLYYGIYDKEIQVSNEEV